MKRKKKINPQDINNALTANNPINMVRTVLHTHTTQKNIILQFPSTLNYSNAQVNLN